MFKHFLVPLDGSELASRAIHVGVELARQLGASITAFVAEPPALATSTGHGALHCLGELEEHARASAQHAEGVVARFERCAALAGVPFRGLYATTRQIDLAIAETARQQCCDVIVMVTHGRGAFGELLHGSWTHRVMAHTKLPLLVLH